MPDRIPPKLIEFAEALGTAWLFFVVGAVIGVAQMLSGSERVTLRLALARAATIGGLATAAGAVLIWLPDTPLLGQIGLAAALASLGTSGLERLFIHILSRGKQ